MECKVKVDLKMNLTLVSFHDSLLIGDHLVYISANPVLLLRRGGGGGGGGGGDTRLDPVFTVKTA